MSKNMKAIKLREKCGLEDLKPITVEKPVVKEGFALVRVKAFGVNESEITSLKGESSADFTFPRILGIEGVGEVVETSPGSELKIGQQVATMMAGLGRSHDGSYAEYMLVREDLLIPFKSDLDWGTIGALPEMLQTAYGSLTKGLQLKAGETLLIHGGTSAVGLMAISLAKKMGATVIATSRKADKLEKLAEFGCDYPVLDDDNYEKTVLNIAPQGVDKVLEFVGTNVLLKDMQLSKVGGLTCFVGALNNHWSIENFSPFMIPKGRYLTSYGGTVTDLPAQALQEALDSVAKGDMKVPLAKIYKGLESVAEAQENLESGSFMGKHVVVL